VKAGFALSAPVEKSFEQLQVISQRRALQIAMAEPKVKKQGGPTQS
jgi:hypothetical protein